MLHPFANSISHIALPKQFTYPFHYTPHPLCVMAAEEVQAYITSQQQWKEEIGSGKMFGVLVVQTSTGAIGFLAAFSGILAGKNLHPYFVPPIYDLLQPQGFFKTEEKNISAINARIGLMEKDSTYLSCRQKLADLTTNANEALAKAKAHLKTAKEAREAQRKNHPNETKREEMIRESQYQKAEYKRTEHQWKQLIADGQAEADLFTAQIEALKTERKTRSVALQQRLFEQFQPLNACGKARNLCDLFKQTIQRTPPAGAGECAAPKLLQYAFLHQLRPIAMAEFWWGISPKTEIRRHGYYYPACKGKCEPILNHMLQGLNVEGNPLLDNLSPETELEILYEDEWLLVVNKPEGMLSVPGKTGAESVYDKMRSKYPDATGPMVVHRLDLSTSGLLLLAKTKEAHQDLQAQFKNRTVKKHYTAILDGIPAKGEGIINLPICPNPLDRPRQLVNEEHGKPAITKYRVLGHSGTQTRIAFYPLTGRTHQLRIHAAHPLGLDCPITGDQLYGCKAERLYLHAEFLKFRHPISGKMITVEKKAGF